MQELEQTLPLQDEGSTPDEVLEVEQRLNQLRDGLNEISKRTAAIFGS